MLLYYMYHILSNYVKYLKSNDAIDERILVGVMKTKERITLGL